MKNFEETSQTKFAFEEPFSSDLNVDVPIPEEPLEQPKKKSSKKKKIIIGVVLFFVLLLIGVVAIKLRKKPVAEVVEVDTVEVIRDLGPLEERIENAREDLEIADPLNQDLTFPPVDMGLRLDKKKR